MYRDTYRIVKKVYGYSPSCKCPLPRDVELVRHAFQNFWANIGILIFFSCIEPYT